MNRTVWINRTCAAAIILCALIVVSAGVNVASDVLEVRGAEARAQPAVKRELINSAEWTKPAPALRVAQGDPKALIGEFFNGELGSLGLLTTSIEVVDPRPLGEGLRLAEVTIKAKGPLDKALATAEWIAVNREAMRLRSLSVSPADAGEASMSLVVMVVVA